MDGLKLPKGALEREKMQAVLSRLDMLEKRANESAIQLESIVKRISELEKLEKLDKPEKLDKLEKHIGALEKALEKKK